LVEIQIKLIIKISNATIFKLEKRVLTENKLNVLAKKKSNPKASSSRTVSLARYCATATMHHKGQGQGNGLSHINQKQSPA